MKENWTQTDELGFQVGDMHGEWENPYAEQIQSYIELRRKGIKMGEIPTKLKQPFKYTSKELEKLRRARVGYCAWRRVKPIK